MTSASIDRGVKICFCCGRHHMQKTIKLTAEDQVLNIGVICVGRWFNVNMSGNVFIACTRLNDKLKQLGETKVADILERIIASNEELTN